MTKFGRNSDVNRDLSVSMESGWLASSMREASEYDSGCRPKESMIRNKEDFSGSSGQVTNQDSDQNENGTNRISTNQIRL